MNILLVEYSTGQAGGETDSARDGNPAGARRDAFFGGHAPASTLRFVAGLADPRFLVEVELAAAE